MKRIERLKTPQIQVTTSPITITEGVDGTVTVTLENTGAASGTVDLVITGSATDVTDYELTTPSSVTVPNGESVDVIFSIADDAIFESTEQFTVQITSINNYGIGPTDSVVITILDDEPQIQVTTGPTTVTEGADGTVAVTLENTGAASGTVDLMITGSATTVNDYVLTTPSSVTVPNGESVDVILSVVDDAIVESTEELTIQITATNNNYGIGLTDSVVITIFDDDQLPPSVEFTSNPAITVNEGDGALTLTLANSGPVAGTVELVITGTATNDTDFTLDSPLTITVAPDGGTANVVLTVIDDVQFEGTEQLTVEITALNSFGIGAVNMVTVTITDNEPQIQVTTSPITVTEGVDGTVTVTLENTGAASGTVDLVITGSATDVSDYELTTPSSIPVQNGENVDVIFSIADDAIFESTEQFTVQITAINNYGIGPTDSVVITILDDEPQIQVTTGPTTVTEGADGTITVTLENTGAASGTVDLVITGSATDVTDYVLTTPSSVTVPNGASVNVILSIVDDAIVESTEQLTVQITATNNNYGIGPTDSVVITILDDEPLVQYTTAAVVVSEDAGTLTLTLENTGGGTETVDITLVDSTALNVADYTLATVSPVTVPAAVDGVPGTQNVVINIIDDDVFEMTEEFSATISNMGNVGIGAVATVTVTITDAGDALIEFTGNTLTVTEGSGAMATLTLTNTGSGDGSVTIQTTDISATEDTDYTPQVGVAVTVTLAGSPFNINIPILDNNDAECSKTFQVSITGVAAGTVDTVIVTIEDDDYLPVGNDAFSASSEFTYVGIVSVILEDHDANNLDEDLDPDGSNTFVPQAWAPNLDPMPYIIVDFGVLSTIEAIDVRGSDAAPIVIFGVPGISSGCCFTESLVIEYATGEEVSVSANTDATSIVSIVFDPPLSTTYLKLNLPSECGDGSRLCALRFKVKGCGPPLIQFTTDTASVTEGSGMLTLTLQNLGFESGTVSMYKTKIQLHHMLNLRLQK
ncbi:uncharacterized protein [Amphiura filiformis]|uniref:uncharacterized protein n=1 Tax=Amphiura filiformis TaxID=82378 RepID=UPI003B223F03